MNKIQILSEVVQNKIAAGEVIERPAAVVKELVENSIDAGATKIIVEVENGGHRLIRVTDDGQGMLEEDLIKSIQRHATSKIAEVEDIFKIKTMGFRGEALPSISSVSRMSIITGVSTKQESRQLIVEGGTIIRSTPSAPKKGTTIEVKDIFFNTPARRKFLKQPSSENSQIAEVLTRIALANINISIILQVDGKLSFSTPTRTLLIDRISDIFGKQLSTKLQHVSRSIDGLNIEGLISLPSETRHNSRSMYILLNNRWIRHHGLVRVIADAYQGNLPPRKFPFVVINLSLDTEKVDINVHPTKEEVRFENEKLIIASVRKAVENGLQQIPSIAVKNFFTDLQNDFTPKAEYDYEKHHEIIKKEKIQDNFLINDSNSFESRNFPKKNLEGEINNTFKKYDDLKNLADIRKEIKGISESKNLNCNNKLELNQNILPSLKPEKYKVITQISNKYILVEGEKGILLIDPHALHERWIFENIKNDYRNNMSQRLLIPLHIDLSPAEVIIFDEVFETFSDYGFQIEKLAGNKITVLSVPSFIKIDAVDTLIHQILSDISLGERLIKDIREELLISISCRSAVLLGKKLSHEEIFILLDRFLTANQSPTCPHGRPSVITLTWEELAKRFGR